MRHAGRPPILTLNRATEIWHRLGRDIQREPTIKEFTEAIGASSTRTGIRYKRLIVRGNICKCCGGTGRVLSARRQKH